MFEKTYEIEYRNKEGTEFRKKWIIKQWNQSMKVILEEAVAGEKEFGLIIYSITKID